MSKRTALVIILCSGIVLIFAARRHFKRVIIAILVPVVAATCIWDPLATAATHAEVSESREIYGVVTQIAALVEKENPDGITEQERTALNKFMNLEHAAKEVSSTRTDETFHTLKSDASTADTLAAIKAVAAITARNPKLAAIAYLGTVYDWGNLHFSYRYPMNSQYTFTNVYMDQWASYWPNYNADNVDMPKAVAFFSPWTDAYNNMPSWQKRVQQHIQKFLKAHKGNPFLSLALYVTYIPLAALLYLLTRKRWYALAAFSFMAFTVLSVYASPMALFWYAIPVYFILPLFTALPFVRFNADPAEVSAAIESSETANIPTDVQAE